MSSTKPLSAAKLASLSHVFKAIEDARVNGKPTVYLTHSRPSSLYFDLCRARTTIFHEWKNGMVKFFKSPHGIEVRINVAPELVEIPKGEIPVNPLTSYHKIGSYLLDTKPNVARFSISELNDEQIRKLEILAHHQKYSVVRDDSTITFARE
jgi:hypothetical protein